VERLPLVKVTTEDWESPSDLGIVVALTGGFFEAADRNVWVGVPAKPKRPVRYVSDGTDTFGVAQLPQVAIAIEKGAPIVAVRSLVSRPTTAMIWLKRSRIQGIADLKGKTIAIPGVPYQKRFLKAVLARTGLGLKDVHFKPMGYGLVPALLNGQVDAIFGGTWNIDGARLEELGAKPVITRMKSLGAPNYEELVLIARRDLLNKNPKLVRDVVAAVDHGTASASEDFPGALEKMEEADERNLDNGPQIINLQGEKTLPLLSKTGRINPGKARNLVRWMHEEGMLRHQIPVSKLFTNAFLPAQS
jgi:putative hydroxymethylpyrimidine transport system substrate-binding protein